MFAPLSEDDPEYFTSPPLDADGEGCVVNFRVTVFHVDEVDTKALTMSTKVGVVMYWTDERMKGWNRFLLPGALWGPEMYLMNHISCEPEYEQFVLVDDKEGRLKRIINYTAIIKAPMELKDFPFDIQELGPHFVTISHWRTLDLEKYGSSPAHQLYRLDPVVRESEGTFFRIFFKDVTEFDLLGKSIQLEEPPVDSAGFKITHLHMKFKFKRISDFYVLKAIAPLYILTIVSFLTLGTDVDEGLSGRLGLAFTMLLAAVALQSVIAEAVPKVDFLTTIDWVAFTSVFYLCLMALICTIIANMEWSDWRINSTAAVALFSSYSAIFIWLVAPAMRTQSKREHEIIAFEKEKAQKGRGRSTMHMAGLRKVEPVLGRGG